MPRTNPPKLSDKFSVVKFIKKRMKKDDDFTEDHVKGFDRRVRDHKLMMFIIEYTQELYDDFVYENYIVPNCYCNPGLIARRRECSHCYYYEYTYKYKMEPYLQCIMENEQFAKIRQYQLTSL